MNVRLLPVAALTLALCSGASADPTSQLAAEVERALSLSRSELLHIDALPLPGEPAAIPIRFAGAQHALLLEPASVRAAGYGVLAQLPDGSWQEHDPGPVRTLRGVLSGFPGSQVAASVLDDGLVARIRLADGSDHWLQPVAPHVPGADPRLHVLYQNDDIVCLDRSCGVEIAPERADYGAPHEGPQGSFLSTLKVAELGCDADFQFFQAWGSVGAVQNRIETVINAMNVQYEAEVGIRHVITTILVRTAATQPYTSTNASTLLNQFRNEWLANQGSIQRDVAQLFTGKNLQSGTIGIAWLSAVCTSFGFGLVQSDFNGNFGCAVDLSSHELGHNWGAGHCSCPSHTMNPFITCANTFHPTASIPTIIAFRDTRTCLDEVDPGGGDPVAVYSIDFESGAPGWNKSSGATDLWRLGSDCASSTVTLTFSRPASTCDYDVGHALGWARSPIIDLGSASGATLGFRHFWQTESYPGAYDRMLVQVSANGGTSWSTIKEINSSHANPSGYVLESLNVSAFATSSFRIRFEFDSVDGVANNFLGWYVDDIVVTVP